MNGRSPEFAIVHGIGRMDTDDATSAVMMVSAPWLTAKDGILADTAKLELIVPMHQLELNGKSLYQPPDSKNGMGMVGLTLKVKVTGDGRGTVTQAIVEDSPSALSAHIQKMAAKRIPGMRAWNFKGLTFKQAMDACGEECLEIVNMWKGGTQFLGI